MPTSLDRVPFRDGYETHVRSWGNPQATDTLLLLHGLVTHSGVFERLGAEVDRRGTHHAVAFDRRGAGLSTQARGDSPGVDQTVDDVLAIAEKFASDGKRLHVVAWCGAGSYSTLAIERAPTLFSTFTVMAPLFFTAQGSTETELSAGATARFLERAKSFPVDVASPGPDFWPAFVEEKDVAELKADPYILREITPRLVDLFKMSFQRAMPLMPKMHIPKAAIFGMKDRITHPVQAREIASTFMQPDRLFDLQAPHAVWYSNPPPVVDILEKMTA